MQTAEAAPFVPKRVVQSQQGLASWYGPGFHGNRTANGERFNQHDMTAAHRYLPFGTEVTVTSVENGRSVVVRINDRGPFAHRRIIDLSRAAAEELGIKGGGVGLVRLEVVGREERSARDGASPYPAPAQEDADGSGQEGPFEHSDVSFHGPAGDI